MRAIIGLAGGVVLGALACGTAQSAGRGAGPAMRGSPATAHAVQRAGIPPGFSSQDRSTRHAFSRRAPRWAWGAGYPGPWLWPEAGAGAATYALILPPAAGAPIDRHSFENLEARAGIRRGPVPEPTIYRLEGPRGNPAARVIRIAGADEASLRRSRFAHAETGALMLTIPGR